MGSDNTRVGEKHPVLSPTDIVERAKVEARRLEGLPRWKVALAGAAQDAPILVRRLDRTGEYFYLATFRMPNGVSARLRINGHTGQLAEAVAIDKPGDKLQRFLSADDVRRRLGRNPPRRQAKKRGGPPTGSPVILEPFLVWQPCAQSLTPFLPFYRVDILEAVWYVRVDGRIYEELTPGAGL